MTASALVTAVGQRTLWRERASRAVRTSFAVVFVLIFAITALWALATPMFAVPDEVSHMVRAGAAVRGDVDGSLVDGQLRYRTLAVLEPGYVPGEAPPTGNVCFATVRSRSAGCLVLKGGRDEAYLQTSAGSYPPLFYFIVGWPSLLLGGAGALYAMRLVSAAVFAGLVALAITSLPVDRDGRAAHVGVLTALTPMAWFLGGSATPSATAVGAGIAAWCGGWRLVRDPASVSPSATAWRFGLPLCLLLSVRRDSIFWGLVVVGGLAAVVTRERLSMLLRSVHVWFWAAASLAAALLAATRGGSYAAAVTRVEDSAGSASAAFGALLTYLQEMVGVLGWLDTPLPGVAYLLWYLLFGGLLFTFVAAASRRVVIVVCGVVLVIAALIVSFGAQVFPYFQGRYALPAAVGVPILAGVALSGREAGPKTVGRRGTLWLLSTIGTIQLLAYYQQLRRYAIPEDPSWWLFDNPKWEPPAAPLAVMVTLHAVVLASFLVAVAVRVDTIRRVSVPRTPGPVA